MSSLATEGALVFDVDTFVSDCVAAAATPDARSAIRELLGRAVSSTRRLQEALPPLRAELTPLFASDALTIVKVVWAPGMSLPPHDHRMWAAIGIYQGAEDNVLWRRQGGTIRQVRGRSIAETDVLLLGDDVVHSVTNPRTHACTGAIHIYGGDFMTRPRSMWDADTLEEHPADGTSVQGLFAEANRRLETPGWADAGPPGSSLDAPTGDGR